MILDSTSTLVRQMCFVCSIQSLDLRRRTAAVAPAAAAVAAAGVGAVDACSWPTEPRTRTTVGKGDSIRSVSQNTCPSMLSAAALTLARWAERTERIAVHHLLCQCPRFGLAGVGGGAAETGGGGGAIMECNVVPCRRCVDWALESEEAGGRRRLGRPPPRHCRRSLSSGQWLRGWTQLLG